MENVGYLQCVSSKQLSWRAEWMKEISFFRYKADPLKQIKILSWKQKKREKILL